jgi:hypothetical protein
MISVGLLVVTAILVLFVLYMAFRIAPIMTRRWNALGELSAFLIVVVITLIILVAAKP